MVMRWCDVDLENKTWAQPDNKTESTNLVPLSQQVIDILSSREKGEYVFPSAYNKTRPGYTGSGHTKCTKAARKKLKALSGITGWTAHDLRRTGRTIMSRLQIKQHVRERVLNHSQGGVVGVYDQYDYLQEKKNALDKLGREIKRIVGISSEPAKVIQMRAV